MKLWDISMPISEDMMVYKNKTEKRPKIIQSATFEKNNHYETDLTMNLHTGTHIDAPLHMIQNGKTMDMYQIEDFIAKAIVLDFTDKTDCITESDLRGKKIERNDFVLLKTKNSFDTSFHSEFIYLERSGAKYLVDLGVKGVGIDALGIERAQPDHETHLHLLGNDIMIVEGLCLKEVVEDIYQLIILPIMLGNTEAAPARAILMKE